METFDELYYREPYRRDFDATVMSCEPTDDGYAITLDQTAFYPTGGGQPGDRGTLTCDVAPDSTPQASHEASDASKESNQEVTESPSQQGADEGEDPDECKLVAHVREAIPGKFAGEVVHLSDAPIPAGTHVHGQLDWTWRRDNMEAHTGEHIVSGIVHKLFGYNNIGFHMGEKCIEVDFDGVVSAEEAADVERRANAAVRDDVRVQALLPTAQELEKMDYRSKKEHEGQIRVVDIPGVDSCACCGIHVATTGQVGLIKVLRVSTKKKKTRLELLCGRRALELCEERMDQLRDVSNFLSVGDEEVPEAVRRLSAEKDDLKHQLKAANKKIIDHEVASMKPEGELLVVYRPGLETDELRYLCETALSQTPAAVCAATSPVEGDESRLGFVIASNQKDLRPACKELNHRLNGRGGGKPNMVQGSWATSRDEAEAALRKVLG